MVLGGGGGGPGCDYVLPIYQILFYIIEKVQEERLLIYKIH